MVQVTAIAAMYIAPCNKIAMAIYILHAEK